MKDSEGREYDGWCMKHDEHGGVLPWYGFSMTRTGLWDDFIGSWEGMNRRTEIRKFRKFGYYPVKVRVVEAE